jgi:tetratricopeptide (TPR) repeat protein
LSSQVEELLEQGVSVANRIDRAATKCQNLVEIADIFLKIGMHSRCLEILFEALKTADLIKQPEEKSRQLVWAGRVFLDLHDDAKAREIFTRAHLLARAAETTAQQVSSLSNLAAEYTEAKLYEEAGKVLSELYELLTDSDSGVDIACELINIADLYRATGNSERSFQMLEESASVIHDLEDNWFKTQRLIDAAEIYFIMGRNEAAVSLLSEAGIVIKLMDQESQSYFLLKMADVLIASGHKAEALETMTDALAIINKEEIAFSRSGGLIEAAGMFLQLNDEPPAIDLLVQVETLTERIEDIKDRVSRNLETARLYLKLEQIQESRDSNRHPEILRPAPKWVPAILSPAAKAGCDGGLQNDTKRESPKTVKSLEVAGKVKNLIKKIEDPKSRLILLGDLAVLLLELNCKQQAAEIISGIVQFITETRAKTAGLGEIALDLAAYGETALALQLTGVIREPYIKAEVLTGVARILAESTGRV